MINLNDLSDDDRRVLARMNQIGGERILQVIERISLMDVKLLKKAVDMPRVYRLQGRVEAYDDLLEAVKKAAELDARDSRV
jgi:hypothetical protein